MTPLPTATISTLTNTSPNTSPNTTTSTAAARTTASPPTGRAFTAEERRLLLGSPGIGPGVISRLEAMGYASLGDIRQAGVDAVVAAVCGCVNTSAWANRRRALERALAA